MNYPPKLEPLKPRKIILRPGGWYRYLGSSCNGFSPNCAYLCVKSEVNSFLFLVDNNFSLRSADLVHGDDFVEVDS